MQQLHIFQCCSPVARLSVVNCAYFGKRIQWVYLRCLFLLFMKSKRSLLVVVTVCVLAMYIETCVNECHSTEIAFWEYIKIMFSGTN